MPETLRDRYARGLLALGYTRVKNPRTTKYWVFHKEGAVTAWIFLGKAGSVRYNVRQRVDGSIPISDKGKIKLLLAAGDPGSGQADM